MHILIAEDEYFTGHTYQTLFEQEGHTVTMCTNGSEVIENAQKQQPDVALLDIMMPGEDGFAALKALRDMYPDLPILMVSNLGESTDKSKAMELGATDYLVKADTEFEDIVAKVHSYVAKNNDTE